ncbi:MAG: GlsB/YeaQ/YmgE family stress response membrane protein [Armatimonadota bacterium]
MNLVAWIVLGGLAGWLASRLMREPQGCLMDVVVGIVGAFIGGLVFNLLGGTGVTGLNIWSLVVAVVGAAVFIAILRALRGPRPAG